RKNTKCFLIASRLIYFIKPILSGIFEIHITFVKNIMSDDKKVIFSMSKVSKTYSSTNKTVLKDIYLSFFYGAKIGILGLNGSGKSSLLKIIAGVDKNYQGDVVFAPGYTVGYLEQEPQLDESKTVIEVVREGMAEIVAVLDEFNQINDMFGLPEVYEDADKMQKLMD